MSILDLYRNEQGKVVAYKVFNPDWTCRDFKFEVGQSYKEDVIPSLCSAGFHACLKISDCFSYYSFDPSNKVAKVLMGDDCCEPGKDCSKVCSSEITVIGELKWSDVLVLANTGHHNTGHQNTGDENTGHRNTGHRNTGDGNTGHRNTGHRNTGNWNTGNRNTGDWNTGNRNTGYRNTGNRNTGDWNTGDWNTGNWNTGNFNTKTPSEIDVFGKKCNIVVWDCCYKPNFLFFSITEWIGEEDMSEVEKQENPSYSFAGGYLKKYEYKEAFLKSWREADHHDRMRVKDLPNFDEEIFFEISGIRVSDYE